MDADSLFVAAMNERTEYDAVVRAIKQLRRTIDKTAERVAKDNAELMDDTAAEDYAEYHAPADVQFRRETRDEAILDLVRHYLTELTLQAK
jgi:hypothetical protein